MASSIPRSSSPHIFWLHVLLWLLATAHSTRSSLIITQTRVTVSSETSWSVEGVASVELGVDEILGYRFDCTTSTHSTTAQLTWEHADEGASNPFDVERIDDGSRLLVANQHLIEENLGRYRCIDSVAGESAVLLLTNAGLAVISDQDCVIAVLNHPANLTVYTSTYLGPLPVNHTTWHLPNGQAIHDSDPRVLYRTTGSTLALSDVTTADAGVYTCTAEQTLLGAVSAASASIELKVFVPSTITAHPSSVYVAEGQNATLSCTAMGSAPLNITWQRAGSSPSTELSVGSNVYIMETAIPNEEEGVAAVMSTLTLARADNTISGLYFCRACNALAELSSTVDSDKVNITVIIDPAVFIAEDTLYATTGSAVNVSATIHSSSQVAVLWYRDGSLLDPASDGAYSVTSDNSSHSVLTILNFGEDREGRYVVVVVNADGKNASDEVYVLFPEPATAIISTPVLRVEVGERVELTCVPGGSPPLNLFWSQEDGSGFSPEDGVIVEGSKLIIPNATLYHSNSVYLCTVSNIAGQAQANATILIHGIPSVSITYNSTTFTSRTVVLSSGDETLPRFTCTADGYPSPSLSWTISLSTGSETAHTQNAYNIVLTHTEQTLEWKRPLQSSDSGLYECVARNNLGEARATLNLTVVQEPTIDAVLPSPGVVLLLTKEPSGVSVSVPPEYTGTVLTCSGFAWPPPHIEWTQASGDLPNGVSSVVRTSNGIVTSELVLAAPFDASHEGTYACAVSSPEIEYFAAKTVSHSIQLSLGAAETQEPVLIQLRISTSNCALWVPQTQTQIREDVQSILHRVVSADCEDIAVSSEQIVLNSSQCLDGGQLVFSGSLSSTLSASLTDKITHVLTRWKNSGPLVSIDDSLHAVDAQFPLQSDNVHESCKLTNCSTTDIVIIIVSPVVGGVVLLAVVLIAVLLYRKFKRQKCRSASVGQEHQNPSRHGGHDLEASEKWNTLSSTKTTSASIDSLLDTPS